MKFHTIRFLPILAAALPASVQGAVQVYSGANGAYNNDTWNNAANWSSAIPSGTDSAVIADGWAAAAATGTASSYSGGLTIGIGSSLLVYTSDDLNALGTGNITLSDASQLALRGVGTQTVGNTFTLTGSTTILTGQSTNASIITYSGSFSGAYDVVFGGNNNAQAYLTAANAFSSLTTSGSGGFGEQNFILIANAANALGVGDVVVNSTDSLQLWASNTIADTATLTLTGLASNKSTTLGGANSKLLIADGINEVVAGIIVDGVSLAAGTYDSSESWLSGGGTITIVPEPGAALLGSLGMLALLRRRR